MNKPAAADASPLLSCHALSKTFQSGGGVQTVLDGAEFALHKGEVVSVVGASGCGKTTLLHLLGGLDKPDSGRVCSGTQDLAHLPPAALAEWRNRTLAFVFQFHLLLPEFSALENTAMPLLLRRCKREEAMAAAAAALEAVQMRAHQHKTPEQLSGGERQRVAVARALAGAPQVVLADEPTGNLDRSNAEGVFALLLENCRARGMALVLVSHDAALAAQADRKFVLQDGKLQPAA